MDGAEGERFDTNAVDACRIAPMSAMQARSAAPACAPMRPAAPSRRRPARRQWGYRKRETSPCDHPAITTRVPMTIRRLLRRNAPTAITTSPVRRTAWAAGGMCFRTYLPLRVERNAVVSVRRRIAEARIGARKWMTSPMMRWPVQIRARETTEAAPSVASLAQ